MVELKAFNLHWLENSDAERDLCAHGSVYLKIGDYVVSNEDSDDWTVSASAYYFLKALKENHDGDTAPQLIPHCGFNMYAVGDNNDELLIVGCPNGINWTIIHLENKVIHQFGDSKIIETTFDEWQEAVCNFSDEIMNFYSDSPAKIVDDEENKKGFEFFMNEWKRLRLEAFN
jgi:hypothetical protein